VPALLVTPLRWDGVRKALMVGNRTLDRYSAMSISIKAAGLKAQTSRNPDAPRPWSRRESQQPEPLTVSTRPVMTEKTAHDPTLGLSVQ
jgi:hypothetical protein